MIRTVTFAQSHSFKGHPSAGRGLREDHSHRLALEGLEILITSIKSLLCIQALVQHVLGAKKRYRFHGLDMPWQSNPIAHGMQRFRLLIYLKYPYLELILGPIIKVKEMLYTVCRRGGNKNT